VDEILDAPLPCTCPDCGGAVVETEVQQQFQTEIPKIEPIVKQFDVHIGACAKCGQRLQGRHPQQTSDALGAAASQIGPRALALASQLQKDLGLSYGKAQRVFREVFNLDVSRGGLAQAIYRVASRVEPTYEAMQAALPRAPVITPDETGWRVGGWSTWLWVFDAVNFVVYGILPGRSFDDAKEILPADYAGRLVRDGWTPYRSYTHALHQTCLGHLLVRCSELLQVAVRGAARVPKAVKRLLQEALLLRDRRDADELTEHGFRSLRGKLIGKMQRLLTWSPKDDENRKLLKHLGNEHEIGALFRFLFEPGLPATNHRAEQAIRPSVVNRKVWGGNRTWTGAHVQEVLTSFFVTARRQAIDAIETIEELLRSTGPRWSPSGESARRS
jgi:transposase